MNILSNTVEQTVHSAEEVISNTVELNFDPMAFVTNLKYMGIGMLVIFAIIGIIILATKLVNYLFSE